MRYLVLQWVDMGMYASARGWLQIDFKQRSAAEEEATQLVVAASVSCSLNNG